MRTQERNSIKEKIFVNWELHESGEKSDDYCREWTVRGYGSDGSEWLGSTTVCSETWEAIAEKEQTTFPESKIPLEEWSLAIKEADTLFDRLVDSMFGTSIKDSHVQAFLKGVNFNKSK